MFNYVCVVKIVYREENRKNVMSIKKNYCRTDVQITDGLLPQANEQHAAIKSRFFKVLQVRRKKSK